MCGGTEIGTEGSIGHKFHPLMNPMNVPQTCIWTVTAKDDTQSVKLEFEFLDLMSKTDCSKNYVRVYDGDSPSSNALTERLCNVVETVVSSGRTLTVEYYGEDVNTSVSFRAKWEAVQRPAGRSLIFI